MQLAFSCQTGNQPNQRIDAIVMTTYAEVCEFLEEISEVPISIKDDLTVFKHAHNSTEACQLVCTEAFHWMPNQVVETFVVQANPSKVGFEGSLVLDSF